MSCTYKFKTKLRIAGGRTASQTVESWTWPRAEAVQALVQLKAIANPHSGEKTLMALLQQALDKKSRGDVTIIKTTKR